MNKVAHDSTGHFAGLPYFIGVGASLRSRFMINTDHLSIVS